MLKNLSFVAAGMLAGASSVLAGLALRNFLVQRALRLEQRVLEEEEEHNPSHTLDLSLAERGRARTSLPGARSYLVFSVVLTGGPLSGKSACCKYFVEQLTAEGYDVYLAPEVPTLLLNAGCRYPKREGGDQLQDFESSLMQLQWQLENSFFRIALSTGRPSVIIYDRGLLDVQAFVPHRMWTSILSANAWSEPTLLARYDLVIHLMTAAASPFLEETSLASKLKAETISLARELDQSLLHCWSEHPMRCVVPNFGDFATKKQRALQHLLDMMRAREQIYA